MPPVVPPAKGLAGSLSVRGVPVTSFGAGVAPTDLGIRISETGRGAAQMEFSLEATPAQLAGVTVGADCLLVLVPSNFRLFGGVIVNVRVRRINPTLRILTCTALSHDAWLDWRMVSGWDSGTLGSDRNMILDLVTVNAAMIGTNLYVTQTRSNTPKVTVANVTTREALLKIAAHAASEADPAWRHFFVDFNSDLHYYKGDLGDLAPFRIGDGSYTADVRGAASLVSYWPSFNAASIIDAEGYANATANGGYTLNVGQGVPNERQHEGIALNGTTGYVSATGVNLHPGNTFSLELWFKRGTIGGAAAQVLWSGGTDDYEVQFGTDNKLRLVKEAVATVFTTTATFTDTLTPHHLVVTKTGAVTHIYVDGVDEPGSTANATIVAGTGTINLGRRKSGTDRFFNGTIWQPAVYDAVLSAATVLAHYNQGNEITAEDLEIEYDGSDTVHAVYVKGGNVAGTGWFFSAFGWYDGRQIRDVIDRPASTTAQEIKDFGRGYVQRHQTIVGGSFSVVGFDGWRVGQQLFVTDSALGLAAAQYEIVQIDTTPASNGNHLYEITFGAPRWSAAKDVVRKKRD